MRGFAGRVPFLFGFMLFFLSACDSGPSVSRDKVQEAWDNYNNPAQLDAGSVVVFSDLPQAGQSLKTPWSDIYWPSYMGGISLRWTNGFQPPFGLSRLTESDVRKMSLEQLASLSPAEKYDIYMGRFDFPTVQAELMRNHPAMPHWYGLCHGWASASVNFDEPASVTVRGAGGIDVPFGSGDVKALLAYAQGVVYFPAVKVLGQRCEVDFSARPELRHSASCRDTNAGSFHLILTNLVGRSGQTVIADLSRGSEVWNFPIYAYSSRELYRQPASIGAAPTTASEVIVETDVYYITEIEQPTWDPLIDSRSIATEKVVYQYAIELDGLGRIIGGRWISNEFPDFVWVQEKADFRGYYGEIESIYENSRRGSPISTPVAVPAPTATPNATPIVTPPPAPPMVTPLPIPEPPIADPTVTPPPAPPVADPAAPPPVPPAVGSDQPIGPILTQPVTPSAPAGTPTVIPGTPTLNCPAGTYSTFAPFEFCTDGSRAFAPYTGAMVNACLLRSSAGCYDSVWPNELYTSLRGQDFCPTGSVWSSEYSACLEDTTVLGPFSREFTERCIEAGFGNVCYGLKINLAYVAVINLGR